MCTYRRQYSELMLLAVISSCWKQTYSISQSGIYYKPWSHSQSPVLIPLSAQSSAPPHSTHQWSNGRHPSHNSTQLQSALASHRLASITQRGVQLCRQSWMWEMYIFVSANTKRRRMSGQHQTDGSERGRRSETIAPSLPPALSVLLWLWEKALSLFCMAPRSCSVQKRP